jgi:DNA-binding MarR family transcriptional regulator
MATQKPSADDRSRVVASLLAFGAAQNELRRHFARSRGMHMTDATAIVQIIEAEELGHPLTPARLGESISLTSGATSILLNRLEEGGNIFRTREHADRRVVTLHSTPAIQEAADRFYEPLGRRMSAVLGDLAPDALGTIEQAVSRLNSTMVAYLDGLDSSG